MEFLACPLSTMKREHGLNALMVDITNTTEATTGTPDKRSRVCVSRANYRIKQLKSPRGSMLKRPRQSLLFATHQRGLRTM
jgi:hypothetical protein